MVGDSVSLRAVETFTQTFPHGHIDAAMNRQFTAGIDVVSHVSSTRDSPGASPYLPWVRTAPSPRRMSTRS
ncbi:MAG: hypothetical protein ACLTSX_10550 [Collinsella sp.]